MDLEGIKLREVRERKMPRDFTYMWNLKNKTSDQIRKKIINTRKKLVVARGERVAVDA